MQSSVEVFEQTPASLKWHMVSRLRLLGEATAIDWKQEESGSCGP
jgi:hypothetical protein